MHVHIYVCIYVCMCNIYIYMDVFMNADMPIYYKNIYLYMSFYVHWCYLTKIIVKKDITTELKCKFTC